MQFEPNLPATGTVCKITPEQKHQLLNLCLNGKRQWLNWVALLKQWRNVRKQRRELYSLSDHMLKDIGISRLDAIQESSKPFWKT